MRILWPLVASLALVVYLYGLGGLYIPRIGDEAPYIEITRLTAESGAWLPLRTAPELENTKPPLLFWTGIVTTNWAESWTLTRLRAPIVLTTFLTAALVFGVGRKLGGTEAGWLSGLTFLAFYSTFQYGRPFLTNMPESLFVFLAFTTVLVAGRRSLWLWTAAGLSLGVACLFKSFALVAPVGLALAWFCLVARQWDLRAFLRSDAPRLAYACVVALSCFALWPLLDPNPEAIVRHFVLEENVGKLGGENYWQGLFTGRYSLPRLWLGHLGNAGLLAVPLVCLVIVGIRERRTLKLEEKGLWILVLSFLLVYSVPSQRQENYLIPTVPALAVLLGIRWLDIPSRWFRGFVLPVIPALAILLSLMIAASRDGFPPGSYALWQFAIPVLGIVGACSIAVWSRLGKTAFHAVVFLAFGTLACAVAPLDGPLGRFAPDRIARLEGRLVFVPSEFIRKHERHRFLLPGARIEGYDPLDTDEVARLLEARHFVAVLRPVGEESAGPFRIFARRLDLRSRQTTEEMVRLVFKGELDLVLRQELIVRRHTVRRESNKAPP